jgi:hypothetical protein
MMTSMRNLACAATLALGVTMPLMALADVLPDGQSKATLATGGSNRELVIDGRVWRCAGADCTATPSGMAASQSIGRECHTAALRLGKFTAYQTGKTTLDDTGLTACNLNVKK